MENQNDNVTVQPVDKSKVRHILKVAFILFIVTVGEFIIAFTMEASPLRTAIFIGMTILKAFYIVAEFMHLAHEVKVSIWSIMIPMIFVVWLIIALLMEGDAMLQTP